MGDGEKTTLKLNFDPKVRLEFRGATITSDAGLLACRELDDAMGLTDCAADFLKESRTGKNILHKLIPLVRQSVYSRLAEYDDTNDAERLSQDPAMRVVVGWKGSERNAASTSEMGRFETELLTQKDNLTGLDRLNVEWVKRAVAKTVRRRIILDIDSSESPVHGGQEEAAYNGHFECVCYHPLFCFNEFGDCEGAVLRPGNVHSADGWEEFIEPIAERYLNMAVSLLFRADAAFAKPELRVPGDKTHRLRHKTSNKRSASKGNSAPAGKAYRVAVSKIHRLLSRLRLSGPELECSSKSGCQGGMAPGRTVSQGWLHRHTPQLSSERDSQLL